MTETALERAVLIAKGIQARCQRQAVSGDTEAFRFLREEESRALNLILEVFDRQQDAAFEDARQDYVEQYGTLSQPDSNNPGGWLIHNDESGWDWTDVRLSAVAAKTEGRKVIDVAKGTLA